MATPMKEIHKLALMSPRQVIDHFSEHDKAGSEAGQVLVEQADFIEMLKAVGGFTLSPRLLLSYSSPRIKLVAPPVRVDGKTCYVFPDQFDRVGIILTLRQAYNLPLEAIRDLLEHFPREHYELLMERKFEIADLLDLSKLLKNGYGLKDLVMAKGCDVLLQDLMSSSKTLAAAAEPGDTLRRLQEKLLLGRLDEMKAWIVSGRRQEFLRRESAQDFKDLAAKKLLHKKIVAKVLAKKARSVGRK